MSFIFWLRNPKRSTAAERRRTPISRPRSTFRPRLEALEDRALPSTFYAATASDLIADIMAANLQGGANTIVLTAPTTSPYVLTAVDNTTDGATGTPVIAKQDSLTVVGNSDTIERSKALGTPWFRLFDVASGASLTLENMTLQNGYAQWGPGGGAKGGAIYNQGTLVLSQVAVQNNTAASYGSRDAAGGGIWSNGALTAENSCVFQGNSARAGVNYNFGTTSGRAFGGAICIAGGTANISGDTFGGYNYQNWANGGGAYVSGFGFGGAGIAYGGAVYVGGGTVIMTGDAVGIYNGAAGYGLTNRAGGAYGIGSWGYGGGLCVAGGTVSLMNDSITGNFANGDGGGIYVPYAGPDILYGDAFTKAHAQHNGYHDIAGRYTLFLQIGSFTASANTITAGSSLTLTASNIAPAAPGATITQVSFYYFDSTGAKQVLGTGTQTSTGAWTLTVKANLAPGVYSLYAQAQESDGTFGPAVGFTLTVQ